MLFSLTFPNHQAHRLSQPNMKFAAVVALALAQSAPALAGLLCVMPNSQPNPGTGICTAVGGTPAPGYQAACCGVDSKTSIYERGCKDNGGDSC
ncbi:hypothetical protein EsH8_X_000590 [Colletotrichum jinshuiense]